VLALIVVALAWNLPGTGPEARKQVPQ
jgi:hypothetical protein